MCSRSDDPSMTDQSTMDTLRAAAKDVDDGWFTTEDGENVHMRYASDLPRRLNALRAALAASVTDEPDPNEPRWFRDEAESDDERHLYRNEDRSQDIVIYATREQADRMMAVIDPVARLAASATDEGPRKRCTLECGHDGPHDSYSMWTDVPTVRPAVPALDVELGAPFWCYQHDRFCQYPIGPHRPAGAALTASATDEGVCLRHRMVGFISAVPGCAACRAAALRSEGGDR